MKKAVIIVVFLLFASAVYATVTVNGTWTVNGTMTVHQYVAPAVPSNVVNYGGSPVTYGGDYVTYN